MGQRNSSGPRRRRGHRRGGYKGKDLGVAHAGRGITDADFDRVIGHAAAALAEAGVDADAIDQVAGALMPLRAVVTTAAA